MLLGFQIHGNLLPSASPSPAPARGKVGGSPLSPQSPRLGRGSFPGRACGASKAAEEAPGNREDLHTLQTGGPWADLARRGPLRPGLLLVNLHTPQTLNPFPSFLGCTGVVSGVGPRVLFSLANRCISGTTCAVRRSLLTTVRSVCRSRFFLRVSEGEAPAFFKGAYFLHFKKNQNVPESQIPHAKRLLK